MRSDPPRIGDRHYPDQSDDRFNLVCSRIAALMVLGLIAITCVASFQTGAGL